MFKVLIGHKRPSDSNKSFVSYGMPSSHANSLFFFVCYLTIASIYNNGIYKGILVGIVLTCYALIVCYSRIYITMDHTLLQIIAGVLQGLINGYISYIYVLPMITNGDITFILSS